MKGVIYTVSELRKALEDFPGEAEVFGPNGMCLTLSEFYEEKGEVLGVKEMRLQVRVEEG